MDAATETLLLFAARSDHLERVLRPALAAGRWVLCDRFTDATYAYQAGGRGMPAERIAALERWVHPDLQPDLTLLFDVPPEVAAQRLTQARPADRFESEQIGFFDAVRRHYLERAATFPERFFVVDSTASPADIREQLTNLMSRWNG
jgi:dTMP kinase